jgi:hypothetical protein
MELRQYTLHPGRRDALVELFEREFIETQEAVGMRVMGQFHDLDDTDRFVWLRGFAGMASRRRGLQAFYGGPVWAAHRAAANATMIDSDDVLLLRPAWPGAALVVQPGDRPPPIAMARRRKRVAGMLAVTVLPLTAAPDEDTLDLCRHPVSTALRDAGARVLGWYATETAPNDFPGLPVREGEQVLVALALHADAAAFDAAGGHAFWTRGAAAGLRPVLSGPPRTLRLAPTPRSAIHAY